MLAKNQERKFRVDLGSGQDSRVLIATICHDDRCGNGHNTFSVTGDFYDTPYRFYDSSYRRGELKVLHQSGRTVWLSSACDCLHDEIRRHLPNLTRFLRWHLCSTDGPLYYLENARYWFGAAGWCDGQTNSPPNLEHFKSTIVYGALSTDEGQLSEYLARRDVADWHQVEQLLRARLPDLMAAFRADVESLGFTF